MLKKAPYYIHPSSVDAGQYIGIRPKKPAAIAAAQELATSRGETMVVTSNAGEVVATLEPQKSVSIPS